MFLYQTLRALFFEVFVMKKKVFYTELSYILGLVIMAFAAAFTEKADFGMSMVVAPAYILHLKLSIKKKETDSMGYLHFQRPVCYPIHITRCLFGCYYGFFINSVLFPCCKEK